VNVWITRAALILGASQFLFVVNFLSSLVAGKKASENPWEVGTLEWTIPSPPPHHNFDEIPLVVTGRTSSATRREGQGLARAERADFVRDAAGRPRSRGLLMTAVAAARFPAGEESRRTSSSGWSWRSRRGR